MLSSAYGWDLARPVFTPDPVNRQHPLNNGCVAWWLVSPPIEGGQYWYDLMGLYAAAIDQNTRTASWKSSPIRPGGWGCLYLDGTSYFQIKLADSTSLLTFAGLPMSVAMWLNTSGSQASLLSHIDNGGSGYSGWEVSFDRGAQNTALGKVSVYNSGAGAWTNGNTAVNDGSWHRVLITNDGTTTSYYVDGVADGSGSQSGTTANPCGDKLWLGARNGNAIQNYAGYVDDVKLWARALSAADARADYDLGRAGYPGVLNRWAPPLLVKPGAAATLFRRTLGPAAGRRPAGYASPRSL